MGVRRSNGLFGPLAFSLGAHSVVLFGAALVSRFAVPAPPIPIELLTLKSHAELSPPSPEKAARPKPVSPAQEPTPKSIVRRPNRGEGPMPKRERQAPATADLSSLSPDQEGANLVVLLGTPALRRSVHRRSVEQLLAALPDYATLLGGSGLSPIDDLDALLIATPDPRDMTATFLAVRHHDEDRVGRLAGRSLLPGDPRVFRVISPELMVLARPEAAAHLDEARASEPTDPRAAWLAELEKFDQAARGPSAPAILASLTRAPKLLRFGAQLPTPQSIAFAATAEASPLLRAKLVFQDPREATVFEEAWPSILARYRSATVLFGLSSALDGLKLERHGATLEWTGRVPEAQLRAGLSLVVAFLPPRRTEAVTPSAASGAALDGAAERR